MKAFDLNDRKFTALFNSAHGQVNQETVFYYNQTGEQIWAHYSGGDIKIGTLCGHFTSENTLLFRYGHWDHEGAYRSGTCISTMSHQPDGRIRLYEQWNWDDETQQGESTLVEVR